MLYIYVARRTDKDLLENIENTVIVHYSRGWQEPDPNSFRNGDKILLLPYGRQKHIENIEYLFNRSNEHGIVMARDKIKFRELMAEKNLSTPKTWFDIDEAKIPFIARPRYHTLNKNFHIVRDEDTRLALKKRIEKRTRAWYYSELIDVVKEYRVMILNNKIFLVYNRMLGSDINETIAIRDEARRTNSLVRYECMGEVSNKNLNLCLDTMKALGLAYGALDLIVDKNGRGYIVEVNTAPLLHGELVAKAFRKAITDLAEELK